MHLPVTYIRTFVGVLDLDGPSRREILRAARIRAREIEGTDHYVPFAAVRRLLEAIDERLEPGWHLEMTSRMDVAHHGPLGIAAITSPTLGDALAIMTKFGEIRAPFAWAEMRERRDSVQIRYHLREQLGSLHHILMEIMQLSGLQVIRHIIGRSGPELVWHLPAERSSLRAGFAAKFDGTLRFEGNRYTTTLPRGWLQAPCLLYDEAMHKVSLARCEELLQQVAERSALEVEVRQCVVTAGGRSPGLEEVAGRLNISRRTLIRRLKREGTSYRRILDEVHRSLAHEYLVSTRWAVAEIGYRLGYQDAANFGRAFRRWYGMAPGEYRRRSQLAHRPARS
ncbi:MAG: AraC family transcriptional regulator ligand-binding domain-containing protein [Gammaproteobacteria bacterium]|jgi:AraC-like DNA-binding protein